MDEREAAAWVADIVLGRITEAEALIFMERAIQYQNRYYHWRYLRTKTPRSISRGVLLLGALFDGGQRACIAVPLNCHQIGENPGGSSHRRAG